MKLRRRHINLFLITLIIVSISGCFKKKEEMAIDQRKINVVATIGMIADVAKNEAVLHMCIRLPIQICLQVLLNLFSWASWPHNSTF